MGDLGWWNSNVFRAYRQAAGSRAANDAELSSANLVSASSGIGRSEADADAARSSSALGNLRAVVIVIVVAFHSALAYLRFLGAEPFRFNAPPYEWRAFPIIDSHRFLGFDIFCAWQDVFLMAFMFFMSALFAWPSLHRKGTGRFLAGRLLRLGIPFLFAVTVVVPIALYPAWRISSGAQEGVGLGLLGYIEQYLALPFLPNGPEWFLWQLLVLTAAATGLRRFKPEWIAALGRLSATAGARPLRYFAWLTAIAVISYIPLALVFTPMAWVDHGPLAFQPSRALLYFVFYVAGLGVGASGLGRGLLKADSVFARKWLSWLVSAMVSFVAWMGLTALLMRQGTAASVALGVFGDASFAVACAASCFFLLAAGLRFGARRIKFLDPLSRNAFAIYLLHYMFVVWLQYGLTGTDLSALVKWSIVLFGALLFSLLIAAALRRHRFGARLIGEDGTQLSFARPGLRIPVQGVGQGSNSRAEYSA